MVKNLIQTALDNGAELTERNAITIARTYTQTANVEAQRAVYRQNTDVVYAQKWVSVLDNRVCPRCAALDGVIYKNGEQMPAIPLHPRCRCLLLPCVRVDELGVTSEDLERVARPWVVREPGNIDTGGTRKILNWGKSTEDFGGWYKTLPEKEQVRIVGPVRAKLLAEGKISFCELVDKGTGRLRTLAELGFSEGGKFLGFEQILANVRKVAMPNYSGGLAQHFASLDTATARTQVSEYFTAGFSQWRKNPQGNIPIAVLDNKDMDAIGAKSRIALLSADTMKKQERKHPELTKEDYERLQGVIQHGTKYQQGPKKLAFMLEDSNGLAAIVKSTGTGEEIYLASMYRLSRGNRKREKGIRTLKKRKD